jgi:tetratricopeptide (TPR) repeat protein
MKTIFFILFSVFSFLAFSQGNNVNIARTKAKEAIKLIDEGKFDEGIQLLEDAQELDLENITYSYELAYAFYSKKEYKKATWYLEEILDHKNSYDLIYQLLGNSYDLIGKLEKAIETYEKGLKRFPHSGCLHLELGVMSLGRKDLKQAIKYFENGIKVDPKHVSNYYWAAKSYCNSDEEVWGMIYGEIFINLERKTKRTEEISKLLFKTYKSEIKFSNDTTFRISFSKNGSIAFDKTDLKSIKIDYGVGIYEPNLIIAIMSQKKIDINSLDTIRTNFLDNYYVKGLNLEYPNILFEYQKRIQDEGHFEAYNHWLMNKGDPDNYRWWLAKNKDKYDQFMVWFDSNRLEISENNHFHSSQY